MQYIYPCSSSGRLWWTPARQYNHVWSVDDSCEDLPGSMGLRDLLWSHRISCLHHHCQMGEFLSIVLSNIFSVFLLLLIILFHLLFYHSSSFLSFASSTWSPPSILSFLNIFLLFFSFSCPIFFFSCQLLFHSFLALFFFRHHLSLPLFVSFLCPLSFLSPSNQSVSLVNFERDYSVDIIAVSAAEDEAVAGGVSREDSVHAAGRSRLLLRCSRSDAAFLFWGDNQIKTNPNTQILENTKIMSRQWDYLPYILTDLLFLFFFLTRSFISALLQILKVIH